MSVDCHTLAGVRTSDSAAVGAEEAARDGGWRQSLSGGWSAVSRLVGEVLHPGPYQVEVVVDVLDLVSLLRAASTCQAEPSSAAAAAASMSSKNVSGSAAIAAATEFRMSLAARPSDTQQSLTRHPRDDRPRPSRHAHGLGSRTAPRPRTEPRTRPRSATPAASADCRPCQPTHGQPRRRPPAGPRSSALRYGLVAGPKTEQTRSNANASTLASVSA